MTTVWVTKWALDECGILKWQLNLPESECVRPDWELSYGAAVARARLMRQEAIALLKNQLAKLEALTFEDAATEDALCTCNRQACKANPCKGECGCKTCANDWADFLSVE